MLPSKIVKKFYDEIFDPSNMILLDVPTKYVNELPYRTLGHIRVLEESVQKEKATLEEMTALALLKLTILPIQTGQAPHVLSGYELLRKCAERNHPRAMTLFALCNKQGVRLPRNMKNFTLYMRKALEANDSLAHELYPNGLDCATE